MFCVCISFFFLTFLRRSGKNNIKMGTHNTHRWCWWRRRKRRKRRKKSEIKWYSELGEKVKGKKKKRNSSVQIMGNENGTMVIERRKDEWNGEWGGLVVRSSISLSCCIFFWCVAFSFDVLRICWIWMGYKSEKRDKIFLWRWRWRVCLRCGSVRDWGLTLNHWNRRRCWWQWNWLRGWDNDVWVWMSVSLSLFSCPFFFLRFFFIRMNGWISY